MCLLFSCFSAWWTEHARSVLYLRRNCWYRLKILTSTKSKIDCMMVYNFSFITTGKLAGIDLVEVNASLGSAAEAQQTLFTACELMAACFGKRRTGLDVPTGYRLPETKDLWRSRSGQLEFLLRELRLNSIIGDGYRIAWRVKSPADGFSGLKLCSCACVSHSCVLETYWLLLSVCTFQVWQLLVCPSSSPFLTRAYRQPFESLRSFTFCHFNQTF